MLDLQTKIQSNAVARIKNKKKRCSNCKEKDFPVSVDTPDEDWLKCIWQHQNINQFLKPLGRPLKILPFPGVVRSINTTINAEAKPIAYKNAIKRFLTETFLRKYLSNKIIEEFTLPYNSETVSIRQPSTI